jgi:hypothetical protein
VVRPAPRRASQQHASPYGPDLSQDRQGPAAGYPPLYRQSPPPGLGNPRSAPPPLFESAPAEDPPPSRRKGKARNGFIRRLLRRRTVKIILALIAAFCCWVAFSVGQALTAPGGGSTSSKLAEWARDHYLGPVVTFGEWLSYNPPKVGGKPSFSLTAPGNQGKFKKVHGFTPIIPAKLTSPAGTPLAGEGVWRVLEIAHKEPAIWATFLRPSSVYTSYVAGIVSMDQRLVKFSLRPGAEDPGGSGWHAQSWIPPGTRTGLLATFNGGFKLDASKGGFYLNGQSKGSLVAGAASMVYYRNGTVKIGAWGSEVQMTANVAGVRQNLKLLVDQGQIPANVNSSVNSDWGATLGGGYYVWRSGIGVTKDGRVIFVYGQALNVRELAGLLQRAGAVEAMQLDINPEWMSYDYYKASPSAANPVPHALLPDQQATPLRYYSVYSRDFTAVYSR